MTIDDFQQIVQSALPDASVSAERLPSGTTFVEVRLDRRMLVLEASVRGGFGVSDLNDDEDALAFSEHDRAFETLEDASEYVFSLLKIPRETRTTRTSV